MSYSPEKLRDRWRYLRDRTAYLTGQLEQVRHPQHRRYIYQELRLLLDQSAALHERLDNAYTEEHYERSLLNPQRELK